MSKQVTHVVAARPNFPKVAPIMRALKAEGIPQRLIHTGQHYDVNLSKIFFEQLEIPHPDSHLGIGSGSQAQQTSNAMMALETEFESAPTDAVLIYGDTNSALAAALVAAKLGISIIHVEAGLRSYDREMPEEVNRVLIDHLADLHLVTCRDAEANLLSEGISPEGIHFVGNPMIDTLFRSLKHTESVSMSGVPALPQHYIVATLHRPSNVDDLSRVKEIVKAIHKVANRNQVIFPLHPRGRKALLNAGLDEHPNVRIIESLAYLEFVALMRHADAVITDSGGIQEETSTLGIPCFTLRENTERPVTITQGTNQLVTVEELADTISSSRLGAFRPIPEIELWDGHAGERIAQTVRDFLGHETFVPRVITSG